MSTFGKKLRECREIKGLSQKELAKLLNTSYSVIGKSIKLKNIAAF